MKKLIAEVLGTFILVFIGTGAMIVDQLPDHSLTHVGVSLTWGLVVMAMIYALGDSSGAHLNPAVTFGFWIARRLPGRTVLPYVLAQVVGALLASVVLRLLFPTSPNLGETLPNATVLQSFVLEALLTFVLMFVILAVATGPRETGILAGVAIGGVIAFESLFGGPMTGSSMNPARSLAPALVSAHFSGLWIYLTAPFLGSLLAVPCWLATRPDSGTRAPGERAGSKL